MVVQAATHVLSDLAAHDRLTVHRCTRDALCVRRYVNVGVAGSSTRSATAVDRLLAVYDSPSSRGVPQYLVQHVGEQRAAAVWMPASAILDVAAMQAFEKEVAELREDLEAGTATGAAAASGSYDEEVLLLPPRHYDEVVMRPRSDASVAEEAPPPPPS